MERDPDFADEVLVAYRDDPAMFYRRIEHDRAVGLPAVEMVTASLACSEGRDLRPRWRGPGRHRGWRRT